jgi:hypothetical protein
MRACLVRHEEVEAGNATEAASLMRITDLPHEVQAFIINGCDVRGRPFVPVECRWCVGTACLLWRALVQRPPPPIVLAIERSARRLGRTATRAWYLGNVLFASCVARVVAVASPPLPVRVRGRTADDGDADARRVPIVARRVVRESDARDMPRAVRFLVRLTDGLVADAIRRRSMHMADVAAIMVASNAERAIALVTAHGPWNEAAIALGAALYRDGDEDDPWRGRLVHHREGGNPSASCVIHSLLLSIAARAGATRSWSALMGMRRPSQRTLVRCLAEAVECGRAGIVRAIVGTCAIEAEGLDRFCNGHIGWDACVRWDPLAAVAFADAYASASDPSHGPSLRQPLPPIADMLGCTEALERHAANDNASALAALDALGAPYRVAFVYDQALARGARRVCAYILERHGRVTSATAAAAAAVIAPPTASTLESIIGVAIWCQADDDDDGPTLFEWMQDEHGVEPDGRVLEVLASVLAGHKIDMGMWGARMCRMMGSFVRAWPDAALPHLADIVLTHWHMGASAVDALDGVLEAAEGALHRGPRGPGARPDLWPVLGDLCGLVAAMTIGNDGAARVATEFIGGIVRRRLWPDPAHAFDGDWHPLWRRRRDLWRLWFRPLCLPPAGKRDCSGTGAPPLSTAPETDRVPHALADALQDLAIHMPRYTERLAMVCRAVRQFQS